MRPGYCTKCAVRCKPLEYSTRHRESREMRWLNAVNFQCILGSIQSLLAKLGLQHYRHAASLWVFFAACGLTELLISFLTCTPLERLWALTQLAEA